MSMHNNINNKENKDKDVKNINKSMEFIVPIELVPDFWEAVERNKKDQEKAKKVNFDEMKPFSDCANDKK